MVMSGTCLEIIPCSTLEPDVLAIMWSLLHLIECVSFSRLIVTNVAAWFPTLFGFHVLSKLLSFMAPIDHTTMNDDAR